MSKYTEDQNSEDSLYTIQAYLASNHYDIKEYQKLLLRKKLKKYLTEKKKDLSEILTKNSSYNRGNLKKRL